MEPKRHGKPFFGRLKNFQLIDLNFDPDDDELYDQLVGEGGEQNDPRFLGTYTDDDLLAFLEEFGVTEQLAARGYRNPLIRKDTSDPMVHRLWIYDAARSPQQFLGEVVLRRAVLNIHNFRSFLRLDELTKAHAFMESALDFDLDMLVIEWLSMQDPHRSFGEDRPPLPGQNYPGLGVGREVQQLLMTLAERKQRDGVLNIPEFFHNAYLYSPPFRFVNPAFEGLFDTLMADLEPQIEGRGLAAVAYALNSGCVLDTVADAPFKWEPEELISPLSERMKRYFDSAQYRALVASATEEGRFTVQWDRYEAKLQNDTEDA